MRRRKLPKFLYILFPLLFVFLMSTGTANWGIPKEVPGATTGSFAATNGPAAVAYFDSRYFTTVEDAVTAANNTGSSKTVYVIPGTNPTVKSSFTINSNITLTLPFDGTTYYTAPPDAGNATLVLPDSSYMKSKVTLNSGVTITNNGTIIVGGAVGSANGGAKNGGQTCGNFAQITMNDGSKIINNNGSKLTIYGYIQEGTKHAGDYSDDTDTSSWAQIVLNSGCTANAPFVIHDYRGGSITSAIYSDRSTKRVMFFNEYEICNIRPLVDIKYGALLTVNTALCANSSVYEANNIKLIGNASSYLFQMASGSEMTVKYNYGNNNNSDYTKRYLNFMDIRMHGSFTLNALTLSVAGTSMDTSSYRFALSYLFHIRIYGGTTTISKYMKMMAGSSFIVADDATLSLSDTVIYSSYTDPSSDGHAAYPSAASAPVFINNGTVNASILAGRVQSTQTGAVLSASTTSVTSYEHLNHSGSSIFTSATYTTINETLQLKLYKNGVISSNYESVGGGSYNSKTVNSVTGWYSNTGTISYVMNGGSPAISSKNITIPGPGYTITSSDLPRTSTKQHYSFLDWYMDEACTVPALNAVIFSSVILYAKWTPVDYSITYHANLYADGQPIEGTPVIPEENYPTFNVESNFSLYPATYEDCIFDGWYLDSNYQTKITAINSSVLSSAPYDLDLYGRWYSGDAEVYTITYVNSNTDDGCTCIDSEEVLSANLSNYVTPTLDGKNSDITYGKYFDGWYLDSNYSTKYSSTSDITGSMSLYAKWLDKNQISIVAAAAPDFGTVRYLNANQTFTVPNPSSYGLDVPTGYAAVWAITGGDLNGTTVSTGDTICLSTTWGQNITVSASAVKKNLTLEIKVGSNETATYSISGDTTLPSTTASNTTKTHTVKIGDVINFTVAASSNYTAGSISTSGLSKSGNNYTVTGESPSITVANATKSSSCLLPDTLVTMEDGSMKEVKDVMAGDLVRVFNHETGQIDVAPITFNDFDESTLQNVIYLEFSNNKKVGVISEHGFFDLDTMKYQYITEENYSQFIGDKFYCEDGSYAVLVNAYIREEYTACYSPTSFYHLDYFVEGMLSMPGGITGLFNIFEYADNLQYDQEKYYQDIETYGLFTYEDLAPFGVTEIMFEAYAGKYLKVALGKGILTEEYLMYLIERYGGFTEEETLDDFSLLDGKSPNSFSVIYDPYSLPPSGIEFEFYNKRRQLLQ